MADDNQKNSSEHLTQKDIVQLLLHNAQHMVTREELKSDINEVKDEILKVESSLKQEISKLDDRIPKVESSLKQDILKVESSLKQDISKVESSLKQDISNVESNLKQDISKINAKFDKIQWLIIATIITVLLKDYLLALL